VVRTTGRRLLALVPLLTAGSILLASRPARFPDWLRPCPSPQLGSGALCGRYEVLEDPAEQEGRRIALNVLVIPASGPLVLPDPVFYLAGGPGASATRAAPTIVEMLAWLQRQRDLVFVDVRGTGGSAPLECEAPGPNAPLQAYFDDFLPEDFVRACLARQSARVSLYANPTAMADLDEVRRALGYERINLFGVSGGTRAAQVYLRNYPHAVRSVVLKGVAPMDMENPLPHARGLEVAVRALFTACEREVGCRRYYSDLAGDWERSKLGFRDGPVEAEIENPRTGRSERVSISRGVYADGVRQLLYNLIDARALPQIIQSAGRGDFGPFARRELVRKRASFQTLAFGAFLSSSCAEDLSFVSEEDIERETSGTFLGDYRVRRQVEACRIWGFGDLGAGFQQPVRSAIPVLLISGADDPVTNPEGAERVADHLSSARHVVFPNQAHDSTNPACENTLIRDFIYAGSAADLNVRCVSSTRRPPLLAG
jgi:pimeloyl-ACP methyl ester carboxylesterase